MKQTRIKRYLSVGALSLCLLLAGCERKEAEVPSLPGGPEDSQSTDEVLQGADRNGQQQLAPFTSIELNVMAPDIRLEKGESYSIRYSLHSREEIQELEVRDGVLHFSTSPDKDWKPDDSRHEVVVTVPEDAKLERIELRTASGEVELSDWTAREVVLSSVSGDVEAENIVSEHLDLGTVSGDLTADRCKSDRLNADSTSGGLSLEGMFETVDAHTISGTLELSGHIRAEAKLDTVSGDIEAELHPGILEAESIGGIWVNGAKQDTGVITGSGDPRVELHSVSGVIRVETVEE